MPLIVRNQLVTVVREDGQPFRSLREQVQREQVKKPVASQSTDPEDHPTLFKINNQDPTTIKRSQYVMDMLTTKNT